MGLFDTKKSESYSMKEITKAVRSFRGFIRKNRSITQNAKDMLISRLYRAFQPQMESEIKDFVMKAYKRNGLSLNKLFYEIDPPISPDTFKEIIIQLYQEGKIEQRPQWIQE